MKQACEKELQSAETMADVFSIVSRYYNLNSAQLTFVTRLTVIAGIKTAIKLTKPTEK